jgi:hypothetical protein
VKQAKDLTKKQLVALVEDIRKVLYAEAYEDEKGRAKYTFDNNKVWDSDTIQEVHDVLVNADLVPEEGGE